MWIPCGAPESFLGICDSQIYEHQRLVIHRASRDGGFEMQNETSLHLPNNERERLGTGNSIQYSLEKGTESCAAIWSASLFPFLSFQMSVLRKGKTCSRQCSLATKLAEPKYT